MIVGTTPTLQMRISDKNVNLNEAQSVYVTIRQGSVAITKTGEYVSVDGASLSVWLTQADTMQLKPNASAKLQVNWTYPDEAGTKRNATKPKEIPITEQLLMRVI